MNASPPTFLLSFDFDGTLLDPNANPPFHPHLLEALRRVRAKGGWWGINTGRSLAQAVNSLGEVGLFLMPDFVVANECELYRPDEIGGWNDVGKWNKDVRKANAAFTKSISPFAEHLEGWVLSNPGCGECRWSSDGALGFIARTQEVMDDFCAYLVQNQNQYPDLGYQRNGNYLRLCHVAYTKGTALLELQQLTDLTQERVFAAGDNFNDLSMLDPQVAGMIACPANAVPEVKAAVAGHGGFVATKVASEGMLEAMAHYFNIRIGDAEGA